MAWWVRIALTPTEMEHWARRTCFGKGIASHCNNWDEEQKAFDAALSAAQQAAAEMAAAEHGTSTYILPKLSDISLTIDKNSEIMKRLKGTPR